MLVSSVALARIVPSGLTVNNRRPPVEPSNSVTAFRTISGRASSGSGSGATFMPSGALPTRFGRISGSGHAGRPFAACGLIVSAASIATIGTRLAVHGVFAAIPEQSILARASLQDIVSRTSEQLVVAAIAVQLIATRTTANDVVAAEAEDRVVSGQAMDDLIARGADKIIVAIGPDDGRRQSVT